MNQNTTLQLLTVSVVAALLLGGCSGAGSGLTQAAPAADEVLLIEREGFTLRVLPASFVDGGSAELELRLSESAKGQAVAEVHASAAQSLKALYFELEYDPAKLSPAAAMASGLLAGGDESQLLQLSLSAAPGHMICGQVLTDWDSRSGFSGSGSLARVEFRPGSSGVEAARVASLAPQSSDAASVTSFQPVSAEYALLMMYYNNPGDYDQNGIVGITDLTPLGQHMGELGVFAYNNVRSVVDGNHDGLISIADITPIGANFGAQIAGYNAYSSSDPADYPVNGLGPNGPGAALVGYRSFESYSKFPAFRSNGGIGIENPEPGAFFWLRPTDGESEGTAGNLVQDSPSGGIAPQLELSAQALEGQFPLRLRFTALVENPDGDFLTYRLNVSSADVDGQPYGDYLDLGPYHDFSYEFARPGVYTVKLDCFGTDGLGTQDSLSIMVTE